MEKVHWVSYLHSCSPLVYSLQRAGILFRNSQLCLTSKRTNSWLINSKVLTTPEKPSARPGPPWHFCSHQLIFIPCILVLFVTLLKFLKSIHQRFVFLPMIDTFNSDFHSSSLIFSSIFSDSSFLMRWSPYKCFSS